MTDPVPRVVKPRTRTYRRLPVIAIHGENTLDENGTLGTTREVIENLHTYPPTLFVRQSAASFVAELESVWKERKPSSWQWRASVHERDICTPNGERVATQVSNAIHFFGFKGGNYHKIIDPVTMYGHRLDSIWPEPASVIDDEDWQTLAKLLRWGVTLRDFCDENQIEVRPTTGAVSSQLLTDRRFYPNARRKVPAKINQRAREELPGNHYALFIEPSPANNFQALYLDQSRAHHYHARTTPLPDADSLYAYGRFTDLGDISFDTTSPSFHGLYCLDLQFPKRLPKFTWLHPTVDQKYWFVYSNELTDLKDAGFVVNGVVAAWGSTKTDTGLARYACWCEEQLDRYGDPKWLKPLLLSAYGVLATRPRQAEAIFRLSASGKPVTLNVGRHSLQGMLTRRAQKLEPKIANVLHRGMIEAATRSDSCGLAQWLHWQGFTVLSIYADAVIVQLDEDKELPTLPDPWRCKKTLTHLQFINQQAFTSDGMTKLPGVSGELRNYRQHRMPGYAPRKKVPVRIESMSGIVLENRVTRI